MKKFRVCPNCEAPASVYGRCAACGYPVMEVAAHTECEGTDCANCVPAIAGPAAEQPITSEFHTADGIFAKTMVIQKAGTMVPQHSHTFAHVSVLARGALRVWKDGKLVGDFTAPDGIKIPARAKHLFLALEDNTKVMCVHDLNGADSVSIAEEHHIVGGA